jgi:hypothetical protein
MTTITNPRSTYEDIDTGYVGGDVASASDTNSYSWIILDWIFSTLSADPFFANFTFKRIAAALPVELWSQVPFLGVFLGRERQSPDGMLNQSEIRLRHHVPIGFQIILRNNDPVQLLKDLDATYWHIVRTLLRNDDFTNRFNSKLPDHVGFDGVELGGVSHIWGRVASQNESPVGQIRWDITLQFGSAWYPYGFDDLERITVRTAFPIGGTDAERQAVQQVTMVYDFNPDSVPYPLPPDTDPPDPFTTTTGESNARSESAGQKAGTVDPNAAPPGAAGVRKATT